MDPCFQLVKTSSASSALTVAHLIRNIEQLKNKDKLISQLEKDLGRQSWGTTAHFAVLERRRSEGNPLPPGGIDLSPPFRTLPEGSDEPEPFLWTPTSIQTPGDVEDVWTNVTEGTLVGKPDLPTHVKGNKDRTKELIEKCRSFLQQNKELTAQNRAFKESNDRTADDAKKAQELLEHSKLQLLQLSRQVSQLEADRSEWEQQVMDVEGLRQERMEDKKMISALRKACSDKDRRIELMQHRKKRRRILESAEKVKIQCAGLRETPFGYEEDDKAQGDGNQSVCSLSSTVSDDSVWDDVMTREEMERNYQRLMLEQLELQKSHAILQRQTDSMQDPQRESLIKTDLQNDLFMAQCRIEQLESFINEGLQGQADGFCKERERMQAEVKNLDTIMKTLEEENGRLQKELISVQERNEEMEFRLIELEQIEENLNENETQCLSSNSKTDIPVPCQTVEVPIHPPSPPHTQQVSPSSSQSGGEQQQDQQGAADTANPGMEQLAKELNALLKGKGRDAEQAIKKLDGLINKEKAMESMALDLQQKVISLQQEKSNLQDRMLLVEQSQPGKGGNSSLLTEARERQENLALKAAIESQSQLVSERSDLQEQLEDLKAQNDVLKQQVLILTNQPAQPLQVKEDTIQKSVHTNTQAQGPKTQSKDGPPVKFSTLNRKPSDRKSKSRNVEEDPTVSKRRKNIEDNEISDEFQPSFRKYKSIGDIKSVNDPNISQNICIDHETGTMTDNQEDKDALYNKMNQLEEDLTNIKSCNEELIVQLQESISRKFELECNCQSLQEKVSMMEQELDLLHKENVALGEQLRQRVEEFQFSQDERNPRVSELEEFCEDLQERLRDAENCERQLRDKLKLFEKSIEEAENQEMIVRERCEQLLAGDYEAKKQIQVLQRTELELRDIVLEKEIVEQALRDKVDFLQKAEAASVQRTEELESIVADLRQQLEEKADGKVLTQKEAHKITELKHQMTFLETDNKALSGRVAELEENEEILRENWRRVADEDFNRTQSLEQKVKMLEGSNRDLKSKLKDAQEYLVIDMSKSNLSLAAELAESEAKMFEDSSDEDEEYAVGMVDEFNSPSKLGDEEDLEKNSMREKVRKLERQLSEVSEKKNTKIESLQEQLVDLKETEIKLSETISEMEMTEREIRAKLALYESSEVTVEKMLKYQSKIEELRTSQESLLDQLEIKENQEMTLQEKMQEMERTLRGKIVTLEVEMKGFKQRELKNAGQIRELEKYSGELSEKVIQQAEKENNLYVKISSLKDELKASKQELESVRKLMEEKEDKIRQAKLLEVKLLEIEMECGKKVSTLNAKLRHREEEFRQKESAFEEKIATLQDIHHSNSDLEDEFAQKEDRMNQIVIEKDTIISNVSKRVSELEKNSSNLTSQMHSLEKELDSERVKLCEKDVVIESLKEVETKCNDLEFVIAKKESEYETERQSLQHEICLKEKNVSELKEEMEGMRHLIKDMEEKEIYGQQAAESGMCELKSFSDGCILEVEKKVELEMSSLEKKLKSVQSHISDLQVYVSEKCIRIHELETEKDEQRKMYEQSLLKTDEENNLLKEKVTQLNSELEHEKNFSQSEQADLLKESQEREASLQFDVSNLQHQVEQHKRELISKLSELETKNKAHCELSLELSNVRREHKSFQKELFKSQQSYADLKASLEAAVTQKDNQLEQSLNDIAKLNATIDSLKKEVGERSYEVEKMANERDVLIKQKNEENERISGEKLHIENQFAEKCQELGRVKELHLKTQEELGETRNSLSVKDHVIQQHEQEKGEKEILLQESQSHIQTVQASKESVTQELQSVKTLLEQAQDQIDQQQEELQLVKSQLQSHQEEIRCGKMSLKEKEDELQEKDQLYEKMSLDMKELHQHLEERDQKLEQAECRVADVELKLQKAENRVRELESLHVSLEMRLEERYAVSQEAEKVLLSKEMQCKELENHIEVSEKNLANLKDQISVSNESTKELAQQLQEKEKRLEEQQAELSSLKFNLENALQSKSSVEEKLKEVEVDLTSIVRKRDEETERLEKLNSEKEVMICSMEAQLHECDSKWTSELATAKQASAEKESLHKDSESKLICLQEDHSKLKSNYDNVQSELDSVSQQLNKKLKENEQLQKEIKEKDSELGQYKVQLSDKEQIVTKHFMQLEEMEKLNSGKFESLNKENKSLMQTIDQLSSEKDQLKTKENDILYEMKNNEERNFSVISKLETDKSNLSFNVESLQKESTALTEKIQCLQEELKTIAKENTDLKEKNESLSRQLSESHSEMEGVMARVNCLESDLLKCTQERDQAITGLESLQKEKSRLDVDNMQLQKEIDEAAMEFQNLTASFEESKCNIESKVEEISQGKQKVEEDFLAFRSKHSSEISEMNKKLEKKYVEIKDLKQECVFHQEEKDVLISDMNSLKQELKKVKDNTTKTLAKDNQLEDIIEVETAMQVSSASSLFSTPSSQRCSNNETAVIKEEDRQNELRLIVLETTLNEVRGKENQMQKRICELETIEKELREQIVDIEVTVIVPLETENQDLKDEIGMVKQERDEAISKISKWDDGEDEEESERKIQEFEAVHQRLEDALMFSEELEKKNDILLSDIQKLENENEKLSVKITDLEVNENESRDVIESLQEEIRNLNDSQHDTSVLEETETTLMDKVLDLEERERGLLEELDKLKETTANSSGESHEGVNEKLKYLEQKNLILEDAEGRYMDKIMELEEDKHRLLSQLSFMTNNVDTAQLSSQSHHIPHISVNKDVVSLSTQTIVPFETNITNTGAEDVVDSLSNSNTSSIKEQISNSFSNDEKVQRISHLELQLQESKDKLDELEAQLREKDTVVLYMQDKLELLKDSEGKLMDKLLEAEEKASSIVHSKYMSEISQLNQKVCVLQEENEFLAENVEQYKKSFKEEKEKCNDLQHQILEEGSNGADLQRTQEELVRTQQMVEEIQSEYEEQLSERIEKESHLREELSQMVLKLKELEDTLVTRTESERSLQEQVDSLRSIELELRSRLALMRTEEDSVVSDSGLSTDDHRHRNDDTGLTDSGVVEAPIIHKSVKTVLLSRPQTSTNPSPPPHTETPAPTPLPRPNKKKHRQSSIEKTPHDELVQLVLDLQEKEASLKKRVSETENLSQKVLQLEYEKSQLEAKLGHYVDQQTSTSLGLPQDSYRSTGSGFSGALANVNNSERISDYSGYHQSISSYAKPTVTTTAMLEKPEDVLNQRIKELEGLDKHNKNMVSELERDREVLHEIARKDKTTIHDLNVRIRELQLSERSLKEQVTNLEVSENSLFTKCEDLEVVKVQLEDRVHELEIHERRLRELVRKLKLDEERWLNKSGGMENAMAELSANEAQLKRLVQDIEMEKGGLSERAEYLEARVRELESVEVALLARVKDYENNEVALQNRLVQLENAEAAAQSRTSELDAINISLAQKHKKMADENAVMTQHLAQLQGQVQDLDRRLLSSRDSELAYKQHVESLQKNESMLQKKVREYELREIDSQSIIREKEQMVEISNDKLSALQRSENRLKYRVQELEGVGGQIPGELTPSQQQKVPQKIEDCQKQVVVLQTQVENLKLQLRQALNTTQSQSANTTEDEDKSKCKNVSITAEEYSQLHTKAALMGEYAYQNEEMERSQEQLRDTILQLRQGKGVCGHEVEMEVYKRRIESLQTFISKLKFSLSEGQTTSLLDPGQESGPEGETLPARHLQVLESERVLQSVRGLHDDGKADTPSKSTGGVHATGLALVEDSMIQAETAHTQASMPPQAFRESQSGNKPEQSSCLEESHWKAIEARKPVTNSTASDSRGGVGTAYGRETRQTLSSSPRHYNNKQPSSTSELEEVTGFLNLQSESELSSHHRMHNDTDSSGSPIRPPRKNRANRLSKNVSDDNSSYSGSGSDRDHPQCQHFALKATANQKHFVNEESLPLTASNIQRQLSSQQQQPSQTPLSRFAEDSFYLPSSTQEGVDSLDDDDESPPPLPSQGPPGQEPQHMSGRSSRASSSVMLDEHRESLDNSTSGLSIRERIAMIERHLQSDAHSQSNREDEDQLFYWKRKSTESAKQIDSLDKNNKFLKEDINRLEKELEEKRRYINTLELWLSSTEDLLKNKNKQTDREMVEQLQLDLTKLRRELTQSGYHSEDAILDPAAMKTELEHKDREISSKRLELDTLAQELRRCHKECRSIESMRRNALDSLRHLEKELVHMQDTEEKLEKAQADISALKVQYENRRMDLNKIISEKDELEIGMSKVIVERDSYKIDLQKSQQDKEGLQANLGELQMQTESLTVQVEDLSVVAEKSGKLEEELKSLNALVVQRYDELDQFKNQALAMVQPLQMKVDRLSKKCMEKDILLRRLGAEMRRVHGPSTALEELSRLERAMNGEEYNTDNSDNMSDDLSPRLPSMHKMRGRSVSMDELSLNSDPDLLHIPSGLNHTSPKRHRPSPYVNSRPRSADATSFNPRSPRRTGSGSPRTSQFGQKSLGPHIRRGFDLGHDNFVAIADYYPDLYSQSGRPKLELALREGDSVRVTGPMDRLGYCEAECNGRTGLVPANYLQQVHFNEMNGHPNAYSDVQLDYGLEPAMVFQERSLQHASINGKSSKLARPRVPEGGSLSTPDPPHNLHVRGIQDGQLVLAWKTPALDSTGCTKGCKLTGYMVYVDNQEYDHILNPQYCQVALERIDLSTTHLFAVQCLCMDGQASPRAELVFEGMVRLGESLREEDGEGPLDTDLSSVLNNVHYPKGSKKKVMALYQYSPEHQSPHDYTAFELAFQAGDVIAVYGEPRPDGFYHGEIEGKRGLVPACFVEDLSTA